MDQSTFSRARKRPTNTTDPTLQWVVLMGIPMFEATSTVSAEPISMQKPLKQKHAFQTNCICNEGQNEAKVNRFWDNYQKFPTHSTSQ